MADWEEDSARLQRNLVQVATAARDHARTRKMPTAALAKQWHRAMLRGLSLPPLAVPAFIGHYRGERGLEDIQVQVGEFLGVAPGEVKGQLNAFFERFSQALSLVDGKIPAGSQATAESLILLLRLMAWAHGEWIRIHPFANGNGRIARLWANWVAMRYGLPPFVALRPRPIADAYAQAAHESMLGDHEGMIDVFHDMLVSCELNPLHKLYTCA